MGMQWHGRAGEILAIEHVPILTSASGLLFSLTFALSSLLISSASWAAALVNATGTPTISISMPAVAQNYWTPFQGKVTFNNSMYGNAYGRASIRVLKGARVIWRTNSIEATTAPSIDLASFGEMPTGQWNNGTFTVEVTASEPTYDYRFGWGTGNIYNWCQNNTCTFLDLAVAEQEARRYCHAAGGSTTFGVYTVYASDPVTASTLLSTYAFNSFNLNTPFMCTSVIKSGPRAPLVTVKTHTFRIGPAPVQVSISLGQNRISGCESATGTVTVSDQAAQGGEVVLGFPDGSRQVLTYQGTGGSFTFNYSGSGQPGDVLSFTADVTTSAGGTATAQATATMVQGTLNVTVTPAKTVVEPQLGSRADVKPDQPQTAYTTPVEIYVTDMFQQPVSGASVSLQVETVDPAFGGHDHGNWQPPKLILPKPTSSVTPSTGTTITGLMDVVYTASDLSSLERIRASASYQGCTASGTSPDITAQISGLSLLNVNSPHSKIGGTDAHHGPNWNGFPTTPDNNHWVSASTAVRMGMIMSDYAARFNGAGLIINDASLPKGGLFDIKADWSMPHQTHRRGIDIDVHTSDSSLAPGITIKRLKLLRLADKDLFRDIKDEGNHLHIYFQPN